METQEQKKNPARIVMPIILAIVIIVGGIYGFTQYKYAQVHEDTDDAQVDGNINPVLPRATGYVTDLLVNDNQAVKRGDTLLKLDDRDYVIKVYQAEAAVKNAEANLDVINANAKSAEANLATAKANIDAAKINIWKADQDFTRYQNLYNDKSATKQQFDNAKATKESAEAQLTVLEKQLEAAQVQYKAAKEQAGVAETQITQRKAELDYAKLQLSYCVVTAPSDGKVTKKNVQAGQYLQAGQQVMAIVENTDTWVVANYKETQLEKMHVGQNVEVTVDAYGDKVFKGHIESIAAGTGAKFALLPPDNASGNFVKVVQRVPVKIVIDVNSEDTTKPLRVGMSVKTSVLTK